MYRSRYRLLLTRALTLIRGHFVSALRDIYSSVSKKIADKQLNDTTMSALLYAKFRVGAPELKQVGLEIQKRAVPPLDPDQGTEAEYQSLVNELHANFAATRGKLIIPLVRKKLSEIAQAPSSSNDLVAFARASIGYIRGVCLDEFDLWGEWFHGQGGLYDFLETICEPLYDHLRPTIIRENKIVKLCQLCTLLQTRYLLDPDEETEPQDANQLDFSILIQPALEDVQTRLVFRAQAFLRDEIERYKPKPEDIDPQLRHRQTSVSVSNGQISGKKIIPADAVMNLSETTKAAEDDTESPLEQDAKWDYDGQADVSAWYPTLRKAIWLLSRIYRLVNVWHIPTLNHCPTANHSPVHRLRRPSPPNSPPNHSLPPTRQYPNNQQIHPSRWPTLPPQSPPNSQTTNCRLRHRTHRPRSPIRLLRHNKHILGTSRKRRALQPSESYAPCWTWTHPPCHREHARRKS